MVLSPRLLLLLTYYVYVVVLQLLGKKYARVNNRVRRRTSHLPPSCQSRLKTKLLSPRWREDERKGVKSKLQGPLSKKSFAVYSTYVLQSIFNLLSSIREGFRTFFTRLEELINHHLYSPLFRVRRFSEPSTTRLYKNVMKLLLLCRCHRVPKIFNSCFLIDSVHLHSL